MNDTVMKETPILPLLTSMALPMVISMLVNSLYNIVDSFFVAQINEQAMAALSLVFPVQNFVNATAIGFGVGINAMIAFHLGAGNKENANASATHGMILSVIHGFLALIISIAIMPTFLGAFTKDENVIKLGLEYSRIVFLFAPVIMISLAFEKIFQAVGRMNETMFALLCGCISNIILDPLLIFGSRMREHGEFSRHGNIGTRTQKGRDGTQVRGRRNTETEGTRHKKACTGTGAKLRRCSSRGNTARRRIRERRGGFDSII